MKPRLETDNRIEYNGSAIHRLDFVNDRASVGILTETTADWIAMNYTGKKHTQLTRIQKLKRIKLFIGVVFVLLIILCVLLAMQILMPGNSLVPDGNGGVVPPDNSADTAVPVQETFGTPEPEETLPLIITNTPTPTPTATPEPTPTPSPTPSPTPVADLATGSVNREANLRAQPAGSGKIKKKLAKKTGVIIHEAVLDEQKNGWYFVTLEGKETQGWLRDYLVTVSGGKRLEDFLPAGTLQSEAESTSNATLNHDANVREAMNGPVLTTLKKGTRIRIRSEKTDSQGIIWYEITAGSSTKPGYVRGNLADPDPALPDGNDGADNGLSESTDETRNRIGIVITNRSTNVRAEPRQGAKVTRQISEGVRLLVLGFYESDEAQWFEVETETGKTQGFVRQYTVNAIEMEDGAEPVPYPSSDSR